MLIREEPATDLAVATRILARAGALGPDGRATLRAGEVVYAAARGASPATMTPYDVAIVRIRDGDPLQGDPPDGLGPHLAEYRRRPDVGSVIRCADGALVSAPEIRSCTLLALREHGDAARRAAAATDTWPGLVAEARGAGALIGAFPLGEE